MPNTLNYTWGSNLTPPLPLPNSFLTDYQNMPYSQAPLLLSNVTQLVDLYAKTGDPFSMKMSVDNHSLINSPSDYKRAPEKKNGFGQTMSKIGAGLSAGVKGLGRGIGKFMTNKTVGQIAGASYDLLPTADKNINDIDTSMAQVRGTANKALLSGAAGPWGIAAGLTNMAIEKLGGNSDASQGLGTGNDIGNAIASFVPGLGWMAKKTMHYNVSNTLKENNAAYGNTFDTNTKAARNSDAKLIFGRSKANEQLAGAALKDTRTQNIMEENNLNLLASNNPYLRLQNQLLLNGGYQLNTVSFGKSGLKFDKDFVNKVLNIYNKKEKSDILSFKEGGSINVIPDGALHKNKHHMEDIDEKFEDVTTKGIPVVTEDNDGNLTLHAEVEREEIIFNLEVTNKLEKLMKDGSDEAAIEAGKLLVHEILENTIDNTGILNKIE